MRFVGDLSLGIEHVRDEAIEFTDEVKQTVESLDAITKRLEASEGEVLLYGNDELWALVESESAGALLEDVGMLRHPQLLSVNVNHHLNEAGLTADAWDAATIDERRGMLENMLDIMLEDMRVPEKVREAMDSIFYVVFSNAESTVNQFIMNGPDGKFAMVEKPVVYFDESMLEGDFLTAASTLFRNAMLVMEQSICLEVPGTFFDEAERLSWEESLTGAANTEFGFGGPLYSFAKVSKVLFEVHYDELSRANDVLRMFE